MWRARGGPGPPAPPSSAAAGAPRSIPPPPPPPAPRAGAPPRAPPPAPIGTVVERVDAVAPAAEAAHQAYPNWDATPADSRATMLERAADMYERERGRLIALLVEEGGKTLDDAVAELREATDFLRYYAVQARAL